MTEAPWLREILAQREEFLRYLTGRMQRRDDAEDLLQETYSRLIAAPPTPPDQPVAWFYRVLRNAVTDRERRAQSVARRMRRVEVQAQSDGEGWQGKRHPCRCVLGALEQLSPPDRAILDEAELRGRPIVEIARTLGTKPATLRVRLHRARQRLRGRLEEVCQSCAATGCTDCDCRTSHSL